MPPKQSFTRERVLKSAFAVLRRLGWAGLTARSIATELGSSTQPLYSYLASMEDLADELRKETLCSLVARQAESYTDNYYLNLAVGYVKFALDEPMLFRFLYFDKPAPVNKAERDLVAALLQERLGKPAPVDSFFDRIDSASVDTLTLNSWLFTHGLAVALAHGALEKMDEGKIISMLKEAGGAFYQWEQKKNGKEI